MNKFEQLEEEAYTEGVDVIDYAFENPKLKGLYMDNTVALNKSLKTTAERNCILAEEMGHHYTSYGNITDQKDVRNRKQEHKARVWAYRKLLQPTDLIRAFENKCINRYEIAEYLDVTEEFLDETINYFKTQYPNGYMVDNYYIQFIPNLQILVWFPSN